jgi:hypothetical protein
MEQIRDNAVLFFTRHPLIAAAHVFPPMT